MTDEIKRIGVYSVEHLRSQWDKIAPERNTQIRSGFDVSFEYVLKPAVLELSCDAAFDNVLDAGCGSGALTEILAKKAKTIVGVDMSPVSIDLARNSKSRPKNASYICDQIESYAEKSPAQYSLIVANMVLQDSPNLNNCLEAFAKLASPSATLVATITHPWFWPTYWRYDAEPWFNYSEEMAIEAPFRISTQPTSIGVTTHFHRPVSSYINALIRGHFEIEDIKEPIPSADLQQRYPETWKFPRFVAIKCRKVL